MAYKHVLLIWLLLTSLGCLLTLLAWLPRHCLCPGLQSQFLLTVSSMSHLRAHLHTCAHALPPARGKTRKEDLGKLPCNFQGLVLISPSESFFWWLYAGACFLSLKLLWHPDHVYPNLDCIAQKLTVFSSTGYITDAKCTSSKRISHSENKASLFPLHVGSLLRLDTWLGTGWRMTGTGTSPTLYNSNSALSEPGQLPNQSTLWLSVGRDGIMSWYWLILEDWVSSSQLCLHIKNIWAPQQKKLSIE